MLNGYDRRMFYTTNKHKRFFKTIDKTDIYLGFTSVIAFSFYIFALLNTSVASALFILSIAPVFAALLSWYLIGEIPLIELGFLYYAL